MKKVGLCSDHAGFDMKEHVKEWLKGRGIDYVDFGTYSSDSCDYPDFAHKLGRAIQDGELHEGIAICGTGNGISMTLNKYPKVRAGLCWNKEVARLVRQHIRLVRQHNNANVLALPGRFISLYDADGILAEYFDKEFEGGRHQRRIDKIPIPES